MEWDFHHPNWLLSRTIRIKQLTQIVSMRGPTPSTGGTGNAATNAVKLLTAPNEIAQNTSLSHLSLIPQAYVVTPNFIRMLLGHVLDEMIKQLS